MTSSVTLNPKIQLEGRLEGNVKDSIISVKNLMQEKTFKENTLLKEKKSVLQN